ncbi:MAG: primosomal protein N' [Candidatus Omnitrophica bacterium]|nr:primosomal protein N' [Candidatus Omnitrophota bacterium]
MRYASCVIRMPLNKTFSYRIPERLDGEAAIGKRVWIPFGPRRVVGYIVDIQNKVDIENVRPIENVIDREPIVSEELLSLTRWISRYYICSWGEAIAAAIPGVLKKGRTSMRPKKLFRDRRVQKTLDLPPTDEQRTALDVIKGSIDDNEFLVFLLHGVTASGKTEVYMQAIGHALKKNKSSIVLVPEISLTPQTVERFKSRFGNEVAVMHSGLVGSRRFHEYKRIREGQARIVVGARSAIFSPVKNLGLVIVDEEHETSYKQETTPRYHAREVAIKRAEITKSIVILGSATPSLESYYNAKKKVFKLIELTRRLKDIDFPKVNIIDMRKEFYQRHYATIFSRPLRDGIERVMAKKQQAILFLNRRGFSTFINCKNCGTVMRCKRCDSVLVYHYSKKRLVCHYCNWSAQPLEICPKCRSSYVKYFGTGTERVESELHRYFPEGRMGRMDTDTTKKRGSHDRILGKFKRHSINILVGTQMIAKGLDFPKVTLVGVISADTMLNLPDFRASERTFNLLTQVAGRAGRSKEGGRVIIQTYTPEHYAIAAASEHDYNAFYKREIRSREELALPPFVNIIRLMLRARKEDRVIKASNDLAKIIKKNMRSVKILGPAPAVISKIRNQFRWNLVLKVKEPQEAAISLKEILKNMKRPSGVFITVDVDPISV